ncbi:alpha/beta hydrolase [Mesorhizobium comanense]|uniref:alpha/beta hydrolase n=1 Tax=Mesorhizobium comanense TaxID=2502215 RepID=UPI0010F48AA7|nr:alpha/beta-hydrolase family protein [Mesorhizobium comanense]
MMRGWIIWLWHQFSTVGLLVGTLFFAASLTPSLNPRAVLVQGILSGLCFAVGYGVGVFGLWLWTYLELPAPEPRKARPIKLVAAAVCTAIAIIFLRRASDWQNSIRTVMDLAPVDSAQPLRVGLIALAAFVVVLMLARLFQITFRFAAGWLARFIPRRIAIVAGGSIAVLLFASIINGVLLRYALHVADSSYQQLDALVEDTIQQPGDPAKTGSAASLIDWEHLGRTGREFITTGPTKQELQSFLKRNALEPIRVYAGLRSADTPEDRARLALAELKRVGAFDRSILVIITPTGTGWIDPAAIDTLEYLRGGDVASVAIQYSYLPSWLSLMVEPGYGGEAARALFKEVYGYWTTLPKDHRPKLYLHGLSLGAMNSEQSNELFEVLGDPYQGALWSGPPYRSRIWRSVTSNRNPGSPAWLPRFRDGSYVRFTNQNNALDIAGAHWGPMRIVYLQYASDAVTFFEPASFYRRPDWMAQPRGPDVSADLRWYPIVTFLQLAVDMMEAATMPIGHGHVYAPEHYIDAWIAVTDVQGWSADDIARLKGHFAQR